MPTAAERRYVGLDGFRELIRSVKDPTALDTSRLAVVSGMPSAVKAIGGDNSGLIEFTITSDKVDREQDTLAPDGWQLENYLNNPVVLWCHDHYGGDGMNPVIANARSVSRIGNTLRSIAEFTPEDLNPFGWMTYQMYARGFMHAVSVGFMPIEYTIAADRKYGINYVAQELLEYSCVPVPANPDALAVARSKGINLAPLAQWASQLIDSKTLSADARVRAEALWALSVPEHALTLDLKGMTTMAGNKTVPATTVSKIDRWTCGTENHVHATEAEAKSCADFDSTASTFLKTGADVLNFIKAGGRALTAEQKTQLQTLIKELAPEEPPAPKEEEPKEDALKTPEPEKEPVTETEGEKRFDITKEDLRAAVTSAVNAEVARVTGRVD